ncbi:MAG TPA: hypothetical protein VNJ07_08400 [Chitinophagales bacterium]|nr:hypothetical protein [Chitinophagales bacterium]
MKTKRIISACAILSAFLIMGCTDVQTGHLVTCSICNKEIENTISVLQVPIWESDKYSVRRMERLCQRCGSEPVAYEIQQRCEVCGNIHHTETKYAERRTNPRDQSETKGFCSYTCENRYNSARQHQERVERTEQISRNIGDYLEAIGNGLFNR